MIYQGVYVGPSPGQKSWENVLQEQQQDYNRMQRKAQFEAVANGLTVTCPVDRTGLTLPLQVESKALVAPPDTIKSFANRQSYGACARVWGHPGLPPQQQQQQPQPVQQSQVQPSPTGYTRPFAQRASHNEETNGLREDINRLGEMVLALGKGVANVLKQDKKQQPKNQTSSQKAGLFDRHLYVKRGTQWLNGEPKGMMVRADYESAKPLIRNGSPLYYRVAKNGFELVTKRDQLPVSPVTGQPSQLRKIALNKAGLTQRGPMTTRLEDCQSIIGVDSGLCDAFETEAKKREGSTDWKSDALRRGGLIR